MNSLPLVSHTNPDEVIAWRNGQPVSVRRFLADVAHVATSLPDCEHLLNACSDRYRFAVGFCAALTSGRVSLLPSTYTSDTLRHLAEFAPDCQVLTDGDPTALPLPAVVFPPLDEAEPPAGAAFAVPRIAPERLAAWVFTSGSTGTPVPHRKSWGLLVANVRAEVAALGFDPAQPATLVGTVPPQHMYGFESTVLLALQNGIAFDAGRPFYPADIAATLARTRAPAVLVSTPFHLRMLLDEGVAQPPVTLLLSATAPLPEELAQRAEAAFDAPLMEIYGSTETGQVGIRRTAEGTAWTLFPGVRLDEREGQTWASGGHIEVPVPLADIVERLDDRRFLLKGRNADLVNIAGKRTSLGWLNRQLLAVPGVRDGAFHLPDDDDGTQITRLAAFVVAPGLSAREVLTGLRERIDPVFLPRPLILLDALPRNATGKLPRSTCEALLAAHGTVREVR
jgi:acyl-coenzyme A synthetase/AMP-(fatty) acid ligase